jgi:hypothetical protein
LLDRVNETGGQVVSVWPRRDTLEDLFMDRIGAQSSSEAAEKSHA